MRLRYEKPEINFDEFEANEYIAACGDSNQEVMFNCNAPGGNLYYYPNFDGTLDGHHDVGRYSWARLLGSYSPCDDKHKVLKSDEGKVLYDGFVDYNYNGRCDSGEEVIVWTYKEGRKRDGHATKALDVNSWETAKS